MRTPKKLAAGAVLAAVAVAVAVVPAAADPIGLSGKPVTPRSTDIVGVGSAAAQDVFDQLSLDYNKTIQASAPHLYSWDATNPQTGQAHDLIVAKAGCPREPRPGSSVEGIVGSTRNRLGLTANLRSRTGAFCTDFATSSISPRLLHLPAGQSPVAFVGVAMDTVTYATNATTNAPPDLSTAQLAAIYTCKVTNWARVGGQPGQINAQLPPASSDTAEFFLAALGGGVPIKPGQCVNAGDGSGGAPPENEGVSRHLHGPDVIFPYASSSYIAQRYHSARCLTRTCTPVKGVTCKPKTGQNLYGCDTHGTMVLHMINKTNPTVSFPLPAVCGKTCPLPNSRFTPAFVRTLYSVVRRVVGTPNDIPPYLQPIFGPKGYVCQNPSAKNDFYRYGLIALRVSVATPGQNAAPAIPDKMTC
jgi:ABC-type phosphate transport system substrate-binding protein